MTNIELVNNLMEIYNTLPTVYALGGIGWKLTDYRYNYCLGPVHQRSCPTK